MNIMAMGDMHGFYPTPAPGVDLILLAGDLLPDPEQEKAFNSVLVPWVNQQKVPVVAVCGNHDYLFQDQPRVHSLANWTFLVDEGVEVNGLKIYGTPYTPTTMAFNGSEDELDDRWAKIPTGLDILLLHGPPRKFGDWINGHLGSETLYKHWLRAAPALTLFGHNHDTRGFWSIDGKFLVNVTLGHHGPIKRFSPEYFEWKGGHPIVCLPGHARVADQVPGRYIYNRVGIGKRHLELLPDGSIGEGAAGCERAWRLRERNNKLWLIINGDRNHGDVMSVARDKDGVWRGSWEKYERNGVELTKVP